MPRSRARLRRCTTVISSSRCVAADELLAGFADEAAGVAEEAMAAAGLALAFALADFAVADLTVADFAVDF